MSVLAVEFVAYLYTYIQAYYRLRSKVCEKVEHSAVVAGNMLKYGCHRTPERKHVTYEVCK